MASGQSWTLWQRLPPRYQLTARVEELDDAAFGKTTAELSQSASPKLYNTPRPHSAAAQKDGPLSAMSSSHTNSCSLHGGKGYQPQISSFPKRKSDYLNTFQKQLRVNSARRRLAETPPTPPLSGRASARAQTAPAFPVTNPLSYHTDTTRAGHKEQEGLENRYYPLRNRSRYSTEATRVDVFPFDDTKGSSNFRARSGALSPDSVPKKYVVQDTDEAVMYIDKGKVIYFRKSRHDLTNLLKTQALRSNAGGFLANLRRDYLKHPRYEARRPSSRTTRRTGSDPRVVASERVDYNRRVEHILNYYSDEEEEEFVTGRRPRTPNRVRSPGSNRIKGLSLTPAAPSRPPSRNTSPSPDRIEDPNDFIRFHQQSKLHERNFYLRTPGMRTQRDLDTCKCGMCRMEMQLSLVTGVDKNLELAATGSLPVNRKLSKDKREPGTEQREQQNKQGTNPPTEKTSSRVTFLQPEVAGQDNTLTITCTLPEAEVSDTPDIGASETGLESARARNDFTPVPVEKPQTA